MGMRRALIVGCGGSGGATLAYMMDQLRSDLSQYGIDALPAGWQFVHLDVPLGEESGPANLGNVAAQGGRYVSTGVASDSYADLDAVVSGRLADADRGPMLHTLSSWAPENPHAVRVGLGSGAGQYRAVGRMLTLHAANNLATALAKIWDELFLPTTHEAMRGLNAIGGYSEREEPLVFVVSSMAGGAGASMALDVCRLLNTIPTLSTTKVGVFMVSPDIFGSLPSSARPGVFPNALAMMGEIVAAQVGAGAATDQELLTALGIPGQSKAMPFARVFPVGLYAGVQGARFGDGSADMVYRGLGRGLAGLLMSEQASHQYVNYDLTNTGGQTPNRAAFGWGCEPDWLGWGSFGFASLSMGRERYAEYAAQRYARAAVDRLVSGHLDRASQASGSEQLRQRVEDYWADECAQLGLWRGPADGTVVQWVMDRLWSPQQLYPMARRIIETDISQLIGLPDGQVAKDWSAVATARLREAQPGWDGQAHDLAYRWAHDWHRELLTKTVRVIGQAISRLGLPYANGLVDRIRAHVQDVIIPAAAALRDQFGEPIGALGPVLESHLAGTRGRIANGGLIYDDLVKRVSDVFAQHAYVNACGLIADVLGSYVGDVLRPLEDELSAKTKELETAQGAQRQGSTLAYLQTDEYVEWPLDDAAAPERFDEANNETLLTNSRDFKEQFEADAVGAVSGSANYRDARQAGLGQILAGEWEMPRGGQPPRGLLRIEQHWRPQVLRNDPTSGQVLSPQRADFSVQVRPGEVLDRARQFVARPDMSFARFCEVSLRDFVQANDVSPSLQAQIAQERSRAIVGKFQATLALALPLAGISQPLVQEIYGSSVQYRFKFSETPFAGLPVEAELMKITDPINDPMLDGAVKMNLGQALSTGDTVRRIDVFGSYPNYVPLCFDSILRPAIAQWNQASSAQKADYWKWRRSRPLPAAVPFGQQARLAMVAGWFLGQIVGQVRFPQPPYVGEVGPAEIWDAQAERWLSFPDPMLTPVNRFRHVMDWLPAVLESSVLAIGRSYESPVLDSLRPYQLLRELVDANKDEPVRGSVMTPAGQSTLANWLANGTTASGHRSAAEGAEPATTPAERQAAAEALLDRHEATVRAHLLPVAEGGQADAAYGTIRDRQYAAGAPMMRDLAPDLLQAIARLRQLLAGAAQSLANGTNLSGPAGGSGPRPSLIPEVTM